MTVTLYIIQMILQCMTSDALYEKRFVEVAKTHEIEPGQLKHVEFEGKEILISNIDGKFYSLDDDAATNTLLAILD